MSTSNNKYKEPIKIKGNNVIIRNCILCGKKLTEEEFFSCLDMCGSCRRASFDKGRDYVDMYGNNKIDEVLVSKFKGKGK